MEEEDVNVFNGNILFASKNQMMYYRTGRKDDLESLFFLLVYLLEKGQLKGVDLSLIDEKCQNTAFKHVKKLKQCKKLSFFCTGRAKSLAQFADLIEWMDFKSTPDYLWLR